MRGVSRTQLWLSLGALLCAAQAGVAEPPAAPFTPLAHSTLVTLEAARTPAALELRVRPAAGHDAPAVTGLTVSIDGKSAAAAAAADGTWSVPWPGGTAPAHAALEVLIAHDGLHEVLSGTLGPAAAGPTAAGSGSAADGAHHHQQLAWWILNIAIVLIAALLISRRLS